MNNNPWNRESVLSYFHDVGTRSALTSRRPNPFFRGRVSELKALHTNVKKSIQGTPENRTALIFGAHGVGKSELMLRFMGQLRSVHGTKIVAVNPSHTALLNAPELLHELINALPNGDELSTTTRKLKQEISELTINSITENGVIRGDGIAAPSTSSNQAAHVYWFNRSCEKLPQAIKDCVFVVCVDEFQNLKNPADSLCKSLHGSNLSLKIVPVYFGLGNAPDVLDEAGVSRTSEETNIPLNA